MNFVDEERRIPVAGTYDVIVVGGGIAGTAAGIAAAKNGCRVLLVEKSVMLGGLATIGFVNKYLPLCDGNGKKVCAGLAEELLRQSIRYGYNNLPEEWADGNPRTPPEERYMTWFSPCDFATALDEAVVEAGIEPAFDARFCLPIMKDHLCAGVIVENCEGRVAYEGRCIVDATGDASVMRQCGVPGETTLCGLTSWAYVTGRNLMRKVQETGKISDGVPLLELGMRFDGAGGVSARQYDIHHQAPLTQFLLDSRKLLRRKILESGDPDAAIVALPYMPQVRTPGRIRGDFELDRNCVNTFCEDSIGCAPDWRTGGQVYEVPYRSLVASGCRNVIAAGRCISSGGDAWEVTRSIPACAVTGQAAGTAAAIALRDHCDLYSLNVTALQRQLAADGVILHAFAREEEKCRE